MKRKLVKRAVALLLGVTLAASPAVAMTCESRIRDVDMAKEMSAKAVGKVIPYAASTLAQANSVPQGVLQLLR